MTPPRSNLPTRLFTHRMVSPRDLAPSDDRLEVVGVFNPGVVEFNGLTAMLARVVEAPREKRAGQIPSPRYDEQGQLRIDWFDTAQCDLSDPRTITEATTGLMRLRFISHLRLMWSSDGKLVDGIAGSAPAILPFGPDEAYGIEDPRITQIGEDFHVTYVGVSPRGVCAKRMTTRDFKRFDRCGVIFCPDNKDVLLFPNQIGGRYAAMHRPMPSMRFAPPSIWLASSDDLVHWGDHEPLLGVGDADAAHRDRLGGGTPPVLTPDGWLTLYHGSDKCHGEEGAGTYSAGVLLLDRDDPSRIIGRSRQPVMLPQADFEKRGYVDNVVFPTGAVLRGNALWVYYGAADEHIGVCAFDVADLLSRCT